MSLFAAAHVLSASPDWPARRAAVRELDRLPAGERLGLARVALSDPVWRVRRAAVRRLLAWRRADPHLLDALFADPPADPAGRGAVEYLRFLVDPSAPVPAPPAPRDEPWRRAAWWDDDPPVLEQNLRRLSDDAVRRDLPLLVPLLALQDGTPVLPFLNGVRRFVVSALVRLGSGEHVAAALRLRDEPRVPHVVRWVNVLVERLPSDRRPPPDHPPWVAEPLKRQQPPTPKPRLDLPPEEPHTLVRVRPPADVPHGRPLGRTGLTVSPLGVSGRSGLNEAGFAAAADAGVNLFLWEPNYHAQTRFWKRLRASHRRRLHVVAGTFAAEPRAVRRDLDHALAALGVERLAAFLVFWVRSPGRLADETLEVLDDARAGGKVVAAGLSTHVRPIAVQAVRDGWDVVMVRHSYVHRGAEAEVLPEAAAAGVGVLTFSALAMGTLARPAVRDDPRWPAVEPARAYRYCVSRPGVSACWTAPKDAAELRHNLAALREPGLGGDEAAALRAAGDAVYRFHRAFTDGLRGR